MSGNSRWILLLAREPHKHSNADLRNAKDTLAPIQDMVVAQLSPFFEASNSASLLCYRLHSAAIPPVVLKTNGVNEACSIHLLLLLIINIRNNNNNNNMALINQTMFLKFMLFNQSRHVSDETSSIVSCTE